MDIKSVDWDKIEEAACVVNYIKRNWQRGLLTIVKYLGLSGMGKSYASLRTAELLAKAIHGDTYKITEKNVVKSLLQFVQFIRAAEKPGEICIIEEMSVLFPSRRAMSGVNIDANALVDTVRKKGIIMLGNYPLNKTVDSHIEAMCCLQIVVTQLNKQVGVCIAQPLRLQTNPAIPKTYYHKLTSRDGDEVDFVYFRTPSKDLISPYEEDKKRRMDYVYEMIEKKEIKRGEKIAKELGLLPSVKLKRPPTKKELLAWNAVKVSGMTQTDYAKQTNQSVANVSVMLKKFKQKANITADL